MHVGERVRGYLAAVGVQQKELAVALDVDPATITNRLDKPDPWEMFQLGATVSEIRNRRGSAQSNQRRAS